MNNEKVYIEGYVVGFTEDMTGIREKQIQVSSGEIVNIDKSFIHKSIAPEKVKIPEFVANIIEEYKERNAPIIDIFTEKKYNKEYDWWLATSLNAYDRVARAWLDGYEVEKEKQYRVKMLGVNEECECLVFGELSNTWKLRSLGSFGELRKHHTRKELEEAGFGWVFDCEGIEVEEVQDD